MNYSHTYKITLTLVLFLFFSLQMNAQESTTNIKLKKVLQERKQLLNKGYIKNYYTIQVFSGDITNAQKVLAICKAEFTDRSQIFYETPNYKVQIGKYRNRLDADRALERITEKYPSAFVFKPKEKK